MQSPADEDRQRFQVPDPRLRDEIGGLLEKAFLREEGRLPDALEISNLKILEEEAVEKAEKAQQLAEEALDAAQRASEQYAASHALEDLEAVQRWEAEAATYFREAEVFRLEVERLRRYLPG